MLKQILFLLTGLITVQIVLAQHTPIFTQQFFSDDSVINVQLTTGIRKLRADKSKAVWLPANIVMNFPDSSTINENIRLEPRGSYRRQNCDIASLMLDFKNDSSPLLSNLKKLKWVGGCQSNSASEVLVLKEYLVYKIYNILSPMSFRVRLLHVTYNDAEKKVKSYTQYAFLLEDIKDVAARNECKEEKNKTYGNAATNRQQITFVSIFQYMIGNTDWAVVNYHNMKLLVPLSDTTSAPFPVPYDFDYCGVVNAPYAVPADNVDIKNVTERYYLGYTRTMEELQPIISVYKEKKEAIMQLVNNFYLLKESEKKNITAYLEQFFSILDKESSVRYAFITNAIH